MEEAALNHAERAVQKVKRALAAIEASKTLEDAREAWEDFLNAVDRVYEKLEAGARSHPKSSSWFAKRQNERRVDELLRYVQHARNSDHHRFDEVVARDPGRIGIGGTGSVFIDKLTVIEGKLKANWAPLAQGAQLVVTRYAARLRVVPVTDRGVEYPVPTQHRGAPINNLDVLTIARAAAAYVEWMVSDAQPLRR